MKKKQTVRDVLEHNHCNVLIIETEEQYLDKRTMDDNTKIFDELLDLKVKSYNLETYREYSSWDDNAGYRNKTELTIEVEYCKNTK